MPIGTFTPGDPSGASVAARTHKAPSTSSQLFARLEHHTQRAITLRREGMTGSANAALVIALQHIRTLVQQARIAPLEEANDIRTQLLHFVTRHQGHYADAQWKRVFTDSQSDILSLAQREVKRAAIDIKTEAPVPLYKGARPVAVTAQPQATPNRLVKLLTKKETTEIPASPFSLPSVGELSFRSANSFSEGLHRRADHAEDKLTRELGYVDVQIRGNLQRRPFRAKLIKSEGQTTLLLGSALASGSFGKVVPVNFRDDRGEIIEACGKVIRLTEPRNLQDKLPYNRFGKRRNLPRTLDKVQKIVDNMKLLGGPIQVLGTRRFGDLVLIVMTAMDMSLSLAKDHVAPADLSAFARDSLAQVASHLANIHKQGFVHGDLKPDNALVNVASNVVAASDFDDATRVKDLSADSDLAHSLVAPELVNGRGVSQKSDVFCLGVSGILMLTEKEPEDMPFYFRIDGRLGRDKYETNLVMQEFAQFRAQVIKNRLQSTEVDPQKLEQALLSSSLTANFFREAYGRDPALTRYILGSMLAPDEKLRPTAQQAARRLSGFASGSSQKTPAIYAGIGQRTRVFRQGQEHLRNIAEIIL